MKQTIYFFLLITPLVTITHNDEDHRRNQKLARITQQLQQQPSVFALRAATRHRNHFINFVCTNHLSTNHGHTIKQLLRLSAPQLKQFFCQNGWSQKDILHFKQLYLSQEFIKLAKTLDGYEDAIKQLHDNHNKFPRIKSFLEFFGRKKEKCYHKRIARLYKEIEQSKKLSKEQTLFDKWHSDLIYALNNSYGFDEVAHAVDKIGDHILTIADQHNYNLKYEVETALEKSIKKLHKTNDINEFIFYTAITEHLLSDVHEQSFQHATQSKSIFKRSTKLFIHGLTTFVKNLNPITQAKNITNTIGLIAKGIYHVTRFVSDITLGSVYLSKESYDARCEQVINTWETVTSTTFDDICDTASKASTFISSAPAEQWVDLIAHFAADFIFFGGIHKGATYLRKIDALGKTKKSLAVFTNRVRHAVDNKLANNSVLVTAEGITMQLKDVAKNVGGSVKNTVVTCSKELLMAFNSTFIASLERELELLRFTFNKTCKGVGHCAEKYVNINFKHLFTMKPHWNKNGILTNIKGFHHDLGNFIEKSGEVLFTGKKMFKDGFYKAHLCLKGQTHTITKTFFPAPWTRKQVTETIIEAYKHAKKIGKIIYQPNGTYMIEGTTKSGITIRMYLSQTGKLTSAFPLL